MLKSVLLLFLMSVCSLGVQAKPETADELRVHFEEVKGQLLQSEEKQRAIMSSLFQINKKMKYLVSERSKTYQKRMSLEASAKTLADRILELETLIKDQRAMLRIRLNAIYRLGGQGLARILFSSTDSAQLERNLKILGIVAKRDLALMKDYSRDVEELAQKQSKFLNRLASLKTAQKKVADQEAAITGESVSKARILDSIRKSKVKTLAKLRKMRERGIKVGLEQDDELLDLLLKPSFFEKKGSLPSPVKGNVGRRFGFWKDPTYAVTLNHKGLFFHADPQAAVNAVFPGKVAFLGEVDGFGNTMILDHGDHYYSVYSGLTDVQAKAGVEIREGQKIASVNEGLYFEIRHFSEPYDPQQWMKGTQP